MPCFWACLLPQYKLCRKNPPKSTLMTNYFPQDPKVDIWWTLHYTRGHRRGVVNGGRRDKTDVVCPKLPVDIMCFRWANAFPCIFSSHELQLEAESWSNRTNKKTHDSLFPQVIKDSSRVIDHSQQWSEQIIWNPWKLCRAADQASKPPSVGEGIYRCPVIK